MVRVNCSAIPATLMESELFTRERGAFTDAHARQIGRFELADQSSIFLDEIGELTQGDPGQLLRVLEERQFERLGSPKPIHLNTRVIAATHRNLSCGSPTARFGGPVLSPERLLPIHVPPAARARRRHPAPVWRFVAEFSRTFDKQIDSVSRENLAELQQYAWPRQHPRAA
jgi:transcriptional regulator with GAF, ATPase, and Fis domain